MKPELRIIGWLALLALLTLNLPFSSAFAQGTAFTYQGRLNDGANPASGIYDLRFVIYDAVTSGNLISGVLTNAATPITNGLFTVTLDFGSGVFDGSMRWLEIGVCTNGVGAFATLTPRQPVTPAPYAIQAASVTAAGIGPGMANIYISGYAVTAVSAASAGSAAVAATAVSFTGPLAGDVTGTQGANTVERVRGVPVSTNAPAAGQHLRFDGTRWVPAAVALGTDVSGTLADARLSTNVALLNGNQVFTGAAQFSNASNSFTGSFTGDGTGLTNLNASQLTGGTIPLTQLPTVVITNNSPNLTIGGTNAVAPLTVPPTVPAAPIGSANSSSPRYSCVVRCGGGALCLCGVVGYGNTLQIFDVSSPSAPVSVGWVSTGNNPNSVCGSWALCLCGELWDRGELQIFDVSTPSAPVSVGSVGTGVSPIP